METSFVARTLQSWEVQQPITDTLHSAAISIARRPARWRVGWIIYVLEIMQNELGSREYEALLRNLKANIETRLEAGSW